MLKLKLCVALLACISFTAQHPFSNIPLDDPFTSFNAAPASEVKISGKPIIAIKNGDFVHPTFSPDGKVLAYSEVLVHGDFENTEVRLYNLASRKTSVLLGSKGAKKYATYKAFVTEMVWRNPKRLEVVISDGDVDSTRLIFSPYTRRLLAERHEGWDETGVPAVPAKYKKTRQLAVSLFPSFSRDVLDNALTSSGLVIPDKGIILPNRNNISFLDFESKSVQALINLPENSAWEFSGGLSFKSSIIVLLWHEPKTYLFLYRDGKIKGLAAIDSTGFSQVEVKHKSNDRVLFLVRAHATYDKGDNPLFIFDGEQLFRVKEHAQLYDAAVDSMGQKIAYCYWEADKRHIVVKEFDPYGKSSSVR